MKKCDDCAQDCVGDDPVELHALSKGLSCGAGLAVLAMVAFGVVFIWLLVNTMRVV